MAHAHVNFTRSGLPIKEMKHIAKVTWGDESAVDQIGDYTPTNTYKMKRLQWVIARTELHNMLGLCSWMAPWEYCPDEKNQYVGDPNMEARSSPLSPASIRPATIWIKTVSALDAAARLHDAPAGFLQHEKGP